MPSWLITWGLRALFAAAAAGAIWYGIDSVVAAFRERKQLRYDLDRTSAQAAELDQQRAAAVQRAADAADAFRAELAARDKAAQAAQVATRRIQRELSDAKTRLSEWSAAADPDLARCLDRPVPRWLLDGSGAQPIVAAPGGASQAAR